MRIKIEEEIRKGRVIISKPALTRLRRLEDSEQEKVYRAILRCQNACKVSYSKEPASENVVIKEIGNPSAKAIYPLMPIKQMPPFDPDGEIMSLALTIPSWADSIRRKCENTDFDKTSKEARETLLWRLKGLTSMSATIIQIIEEINRNDK